MTLRCGGWIMSFRRLVTRGVAGVTGVTGVADVADVAAVLVAGPAAHLAPAAAAAVAVVLSPQGGEPLLLGVCVDVGADDEADDVEEGHPGGLGQELLGKGQRDGRDDPADLHDGHEAGLDGCADLVECAGAGDEGHGGQVDAVLDGRDLGGLALGAVRVGMRMGTGAYDQVAEENLQDLGLDAGAALEQLLQDADEDVAERGGDQGAVDGHLGHARGEVVAALAAVVGDPRGQELLQARQRARGEHLGAQRVALQLLEVRLRRMSVGGPRAPNRGRSRGRGRCGAQLTARYPLGPAPLVSASPTECSRSSWPLPLTASATAAVVLVVSFSNLTDMAAGWCATVAGGRACLEGLGGGREGEGEWGGSGETDTTNGHDGACWVLFTTAVAPALLVRGRFSAALLPHRGGCAPGSQHHQPRSLGLGPCDWRLLTFLRVFFVSSWCSGAGAAFPCPQQKPCETRSGAVPAAGDMLPSVSLDDTSSACLQRRQPPRVDTYSSVRPEGNRNLSAAARRQRPCVACRELRV